MKIAKDVWFLLGAVAGMILAFGVFVYLDWFQGTEKKVQERVLRELASKRCICGPEVEKIAIECAKNGDGG